MLLDGSIARGSMAGKAMARLDRARGGVAVQIRNSPRETGVFCVQDHILR